MEAKELKQRTRALSEEDRLIVTANIPLSNLRREIVRRDAQANKVIDDAIRAFIPVTERGNSLTLEEKNAVIKNLRKAVRA
jgi:hypothetical protein